MKDTQSMAVMAGFQTSSASVRGIRERCVFKSRDTSWGFGTSNHTDTYLLYLPESPVFTSASGWLFQMPSGPETPGWEYQWNSSPNVADECSHNEQAVYFSLHCLRNHSRCKQPGMGFPAVQMWMYPPCKLSKFSHIHTHRCFPRTTSWGWGCPAESCYLKQICISLT